MTDEASSHTGAAEQSAESKFQIPKRSLLTKVLPTDRISFESQVELARAYAAVYAANGGQPVTNEQAGDVLNRKLSASTVSQSNGFFSDIGLITRSDKGVGFIPSNEVIEYNNACQWDEAEARLKLRPIFEKTWFHRCLVPRLQLSPQPLASCLLMLASESKATSEHNEKLVNLLNFLQLVGIVSTAGGTVTLLQHKSLVPATATQKDVPAVGISGGKETTVSEIEKEESGYHTYILPLPKARKITVKAPLDITKSEIERLKKWAEFTLFLEWKDDTTKQTE